MNANTFAIHSSPDFCTGSFSSVFLSLWPVCLKPLLRASVFLSLLALVEEKISFINFSYLAKGLFSQMAAQMQKATDWAVLIH